ncbi:hypothetical protein JYT36_00280 [Bacteroidales bacterium AH-315-N07]|nr:hypothetical protein [Bacteroidales bacterium AH-315-N07]
MIPDKLIEFLKGPVIGAAGTRDSNLQSSVHRIWGTKVNDDKESMTVYVAEVMADNMLKNLEDNGHIACTIGEPISHENYQFKGKFISSKKSDVVDEAFQDECIMKFVEQERKSGMPEEALQVFSKIIYKPSIAITFKVEEIYNQTPGPGAGAKLN